MEYLTDVYGLNIPDFELDTTGDWHASCLDWSKAVFKESDESLLRDWGIRQVRVEAYPFLGEKIAVANHLRALADIIIDGRFTLLRGMRRDFLGTDKYNLEFFTAINSLKNSDNWENINSFMRKEFGLEWVNYCETTNDASS